MKGVLKMVLVATLALGSMPLPRALGANNGLASQVVSLSDVYAGRTYAGWSAAWWQWTLSNPSDNSPIFDTGACGVGQTGEVFFLAGKTCQTTDPNCSFVVSRNCTVPSGKALYFPILNFEDSFPEEQVAPTGPGGTPLTTINQLRQFVGPIADLASDLSVTLDGKSLQNASAYRVQSEPFAITLPEPNQYEAVGENVPAGVPAGTPYIGVDEGFYVMLKPPAKGTHLLHFAGSLPAFGFALDITYHLTVQ